MFLSQIPTDARTNNLNFIRLIAAVAVTFGHSFALITGGHYEFLPGIHSSTFGFLAVAVFFGLSGYLITQSFCKQNDWKAFLAARCLRIFPGLLFANFITILIISLIVRQEGWGIFTNLDNWGYFFGALLFKFYFFSDAFQGLPYSGVNGSLWTLPIEFRLYLLVLVLGLLGFFRRLWLLGIFIALSLLALVLQIDFIVKEVFPHLFGVGGYEATFLSLPFCFGLGSVAYFFSRKVYLSIAVGFILLFSLYVSENWAVRCVSYIYAAYVFGYHPRLYVPQLNFKTDISYGVYVLSWPVQQMLIFLKWAHNPYDLFALTMAIVIPLSFLSWHAIEKPALKLKGRLIKGRTLAHS